MRNNGFVSGMMAGMALGAMLLVALSPGVRHPMMAGMGRMGRMMRRSDMMNAMMPGDAE